MFSTQNRIEQSMLNVKLKDKINIHKIKKKLTNNIDAIYLIRKNIWKWAGHIARLTDNRWTYKVTHNQLYGKRKKGKPKARWRDNFGKMLKNSFYSQIAPDRAEWARLGEAFALNRA